jgi:NAD(P)-dependent dehydrogenase (short-subunit alcohol dehydrogenase family)
MKIPAISVKMIRPSFPGPYIETLLLTSTLDEAALHPVWRLGPSEDVTALVVFLASDQASLITGSYHLVDGGYTAP